VLAVGVWIAKANGILAHMIRSFGFNCSRRSWTDCRQVTSHPDTTSKQKGLPSGGLFYQRNLAVYRGRNDLIAAGNRSSRIFLRSAAIPPRYDGTGVAVSTSTNAITEKQTPATAADTNM
jgi:hypothetical protein